MLVYLISDQNMKKLKKKEKRFYNQSIWNIFGFFRTARKLKQHQEQIEELREMSNNNKHYQQQQQLQKKNSLRGRTYSEISLDLTAYNRHRHNKELLDQEGSEFVGFTNEFFQPDPSSGRQHQRRKRPSIGPGNNQESHRIPSYSEINPNFPPPPFEFINKIYDDSNTTSVQQTPARSPPNSPAPAPPPPPPPPPPPADRQPTTTLPKQQTKRHDPTVTSSSTAPINSLLDEFKNKMKDNQTRDHDNANSGDNGEEGRVLRASTFSRTNTEGSQKKGRSSTDVPSNNKPQTRRGTPYEAEEDAEDEQEFRGFRNRTFDPDISEASSRF